MKECKCKNHIGDRLLDELMFGRNSRYSDGLHYNCKQCVAATDRDRYAADKTKYKERVAAWQHNNPNRVNESSKQYRINNPERRAASTKQWRSNNSQLICFLANKRRANKLSATPKWADLNQIKQLYLDCPPGYHLHHIVPLQEDVTVCGLHCCDNLVCISVASHTAVHSSIDQLQQTYAVPKNHWIIEK